MNDLRNAELNLGKKEDQLRRKRSFLTFLRKFDIFFARKDGFRDRNDVKNSNGQQ